MEALKEFGLTDLEINVYTTLLKFGSLKVTPLAKKTNLARTTLYDTLKRLVEKGIVHVKLISGVKTYTGIEPKKLLGIMRARTKQLEEFLPKLQKVYLPQEPSVVEYYEGRRGVLTVLLDILHSKSDFIVYGNHAVSEDILEDIPSWFSAKRLYLGLKVKRLMESVKPAYHSDVQYRDYTEVRITKKLSDVSTITFLYAGKVVIYTHRDTVSAVIINNKEIYDMQKMLFEALWDEAEVVPC